MLFARLRHGLRHLTRRPRRRNARPERDLTPLACPHCRGGLPGTAEDDAIAVVTACPATGRRVRASADRRAQVVHIDLDTEQGLRHVATVECGDFVVHRVRVWDPAHVPLRLRRDLPALAAYVWNVAARTPAQRPAWADPGRGDLADAATAFTNPDPDADAAALGAGGIDPRLDAALVELNTELDYWIGMCAANSSLRDPAVTCSLMATVLTGALDDDRDRSYIVALAAAALTRLAHPPERHDLPPDPDTGERR